MLLTQDDILLVHGVQEINYPFDILLCQLTVVVEAKKHRPLISSFQASIAELARGVDHLVVAITEDDSDLVLVILLSR